MFHPARQELQLAEIKDQVESTISDANEAATITLASQPNKSINIENLIFGYNNSLAFDGVLTLSSEGMNTIEIPVIEKTLTEINLSLKANEGKDVVITLTACGIGVKGFLTAIYSVF